MPGTPLSDAHTSGRRLRAWIFAPPVVALLSVTLLAMNLLQLASVVLLPFSRRAFRAFNGAAADAWWGLSVTMGELVYGIGFAATGDPLPAGENALLVVNHQTMADIPFLLALVKRHGRLGDLKWFIKDVLKYVPGVGWGTLFLDCLFVKRNWSRDRKTIERVFARLRRHRAPFWIVLFAEGTRLTDSKLEKSRRRAIAAGKPPLAHVLGPRPAGFAASVQGLGDRLHAVYDVTIGYPAGVPTLRQYVAGYAPMAHLHVRRFEVAGLPPERAALADWLAARFVEKDAALERFYGEGRF
jgi:lysocardiolipin and lysophospholipid acyltransferase